MESYSRPRGVTAAIEVLSGMTQSEIRDVLEEVYRRRGAPEQLAQMEMESARIDTLDETVSEVMNADRGSFALRARDCRFLRNSIALVPKVGWEASLAAAAYVLSFELESSESLLEEARLTAREVRR